MAIKNMQLDPNAVTTNPAEGGYKVVAIQVNNVGKLDIKYDIPKWSGLGMMICQTGTNEQYDGWIDTLLANGFDEFREVPTYQMTDWLAQSKASVIRSVAKGAKYIWGVSSSNVDDATRTIVKSTWEAFRTAIKDNALWAQDNGVYEFQLGNEEEFHIHRHPISMVRLDNIVTATFTEDHGFTAPNPVYIWNGDGGDDYNDYPATITVTGAKTFTYPSAGDDGTHGNPTGFDIGDFTVASLITNLKSVATEVQAIFTNGDVSYSCLYPYIGTWVSAGRGDLDKVASNVYKKEIGNNDWKTEITDLVNGFGVDHTYLTEFSLNANNLDDYSADEAIQATAITEMIDYIKASGMTRALYFMWYHPSFNTGVLKDDWTYRLLWNSLLNSG